MVSRQGFIGKVRFPVKISNAVFQLACGSAAPSVFFCRHFFALRDGILPRQAEIQRCFPFWNAHAAFFQTDRGFDPVWRALVKNMAAVFLSFDVGNPPFVAGTLLWRIG